MFRFLPKRPGGNISDFPNDLNLSKFNEEIGYGFSGNVVLYTSPDRNEIAIICCNSNNNKAGYKMMKNEVKMYKRLNSLQGICLQILVLY